MPATKSAPSRRALDAAMERNRRAGHENAGALSESHGVLPVEPPLERFPPEFRAWDDAAAALPRLQRDQTVRAYFDAMPVLDAGGLDEIYLRRAALLLGGFAHAYHWMDYELPYQIPSSIVRPWQEVSARLDRRAPFLSYDDIFLYNWKLCDARVADPMRLPNLALLMPVFGNNAERVFLLAQVEIAARMAPLVGAVVRAQEAVLAGDHWALRRELSTITDRLLHVATHSLLAIDPNPHSENYVDPVVWAKTIARFGVPPDEQVATPSGTAAALFHFLDVFIGRTHYDDELGRDALMLREWMPENHRSFIDALAEISVRSFVEESDNPCLLGAFQQMLEAYMGPKGLLGAHRLKVYGFLETAYKVGRPSTTGGYAGRFHERPWDQVHDALDRARKNRFDGFQAHCPWGRVRARQPTAPGGSDQVQRVLVDIAEQGLRYQPGDRLAVMPENHPDLIDKTLRALQATGEEPITLSKTWRDAMRARPDVPLPDSGRIPLATMLRFARLRPLERSVAKELHRLTRSPALERVLETRLEDQWELWDILEEISRTTTYDTRRLWRAEPWQDESLCRIVPPDRPRMYSISSAPEAPGLAADELGLTVGSLSFKSLPAADAEARERVGTGSSFLIGQQGFLAAEQGMPIRIVRPSRFRLPDDPNRPVVMFAGGTGIAPFMGFLSERSRAGSKGRNWLFLGTRSEDKLYYRDQLQALVQGGHLVLRVAFSQQAAEVHFDEAAGRLLTRPGRACRIGELMLQEDNARALWSLVRSPGEGGLGAYFYICGQVGFAATVMNALRAIVRREQPDDTARTASYLYRLAAQNRLMMDIFTSFAPHHDPEAADHRVFDASEVARHNNPRDGYWLTINGNVYDLTEFVHLHPGGSQIIVSNAGTDATLEWQAVDHHIDSEVDAMLGMYKIGTIRRLRFDNRWGIALFEEGVSFVPLADAYRLWIRYLFLVLQLENAVNHDYSFLYREVTRALHEQEMTPLELMLAANAHTRFLDEHLDELMGPRVQRLWAAIVGLCSPHEKIGRIRKTLNAALQGEQVGAARSHSVRMRALVSEYDARKLGRSARDASAWESRARRLATIAFEHDISLLESCKRRLIEGLGLFERHESRIMECAGAELVRVLLGLAEPLTEYFDRFAAACADLDS